MKNKTIFITLLCFFLFTNAFTQTVFTGTPAINSIKKMLDFAVKQQRKPYRLGAEGPNAFDCSGFTRYCYKQLGVTLNRTSQAQAENGKKVGKKRVKEGDLVFFKGSKGNSIGHVGIVFEKKEGKNFNFIHVSTSLGVVIENSQVAYYKKRYKTARRITTDKQIRKEIKKSKRTQ